MLVLFRGPQCHWPDSVDDTHWMVVHSEDQSGILLSSVILIQRLMRTSHSPRAFPTDQLALVSMNFALHGRRTGLRFLAKKKKRKREHFMLRERGM
ncbi:hypothetical protein PGTUg99_024389 [Puccinia graminis f. sp. tritici]|uniref:Uncharacterized protein n=1 Tax=Puccinia graminis f. sp. tritici TaxID=56615 RepID=A0A5B0RMK5_PUCGR|nr:hypothetical protein PGTUg99_024389 [Puccinia graminis f. sp. tritici]